MAGRPPTDNKHRAKRRCAAYISQHKKAETLSQLLCSCRRSRTGPNRRRIPCTPGLVSSRCSKQSSGCASGCKAMSKCPRCRQTLIPSWRQVGAPGHVSVRVWSLLHLSRAIADALTKWTRWAGPLRSLRWDVEVDSIACAVVQSLLQLRDQGNQDRQGGCGERELQVCTAVDVVAIQLIICHESSPASVRARLGVLGLSLGGMV